MALYRLTIKTRAWRALSAGARATFFVLAANHNTNSQNAVFLSARAGSKELGVCKDTVCKWLHELEHYGFIVEVVGAHLGVTGTGKAARYRLTDRRYAGQPPTYDFQSWDGTLYDPTKQNPVRKSRTPCPKKLDTSEAATTPNMEQCPILSDIRTAPECPKDSDITSLTTPQRQPLAWSTPRVVPIDLVGEFRAVGYRLRRRRGWWCWYSIEAGEEHSGAGDLEGVLNALAVL